MQNLLFFTLCVLFSNALFGQCINFYNDDFNDGNLTGWSNTTDWTNSGTALQHGLSGVPGDSYIYYDMGLQDLTANGYQWEFCLRDGNWTPSNGNKFWTYLISDDANLNSGNENGYAVGVNFAANNDLLTLYEVTNGNATALITSNFDWEASSDVCVRVARDASGNWIFFYNPNGTGEVFAGYATDVTHTSGNYFGLSFTYTQTRAGRLYMDDVSFSKGASCGAIVCPTDIFTVEEIIGNGEITLNWTNPICSFDGVVILASEGSPVESTINQTNLNGLVNDSDFSAANADWSTKTDANDAFDITTFGTDNTNYVVYQGTGNTVTLTGLTNETVYHFKIFIESGTSDWSTGVNTDGIPSAEICEAFDDGNIPTGWQSVDVSKYNSGNYAPKSLKFSGTGHSLTTPLATNITALSFHIKGNSTDVASEFLVEGYDGSSYTTIDNITNITGSYTLKSYANLPNYSGLRFSYTKVSGNVAFDDICITADNISMTPLPVELLHFTAKPKDKTTMLTWATATEINNDYFEIQHSLDGLNFETIGTVKGAGTTHEIQEYSFIDKTPKNGLNYYRLRQMDIDGQFEYHKITSVLITSEQNDIAIIPTKVHHQFDIIFGQTMETTAQMTIYNVNGQIVKSTILNIHNNRQTIDVTHLQAGMYFIKLNIDNTIITKRFIKF